MIFRPLAALDIDQEVLTSFPRKGSIHRTVTRDTGILCQAPNPVNEGRGLGMPSPASLPDTSTPGRFAGRSGRAYGPPWHPPGQPTTLVS